MRFVPAACLALLVASPVFADPAHQFIDSPSPQRVPLQRHWECVPVARALSGIQIFGNASTWWGQAEGHFDRGNVPRRGAVLAFKPHGSMRLGHVAAISKVIDARTVLVTHGNWSIIDGRRGQIERNVKVIDVSPDNDWTQVRVWYAPLGDLGGTIWPVHGFIYPQSKAPMTLPDGANVASTMAGIIKAKIDAPAVMPKPNKVVSKNMNERTPPATANKIFKPTGRLDYLEKMLPKLK
jgi:surface antigen